MIDSCPQEIFDHFKELQMHCLQNEFNFDSQIISENKLDEDPLAHYTKHHLGSYIKGLGDAYCSLICKEHDCKGKKIKFGNLKKEVLQYKSYLEEKESKTISFEEAWELYLFKLGPSFWKAVTDISSIYLLNNLKEIPDEFLETIAEV